MVKKLIAELLGTLILVLFGCGSAVLMGAQIGMLGISLAFGLAIVAAAYGLGAISGAHLNPAVSLGMVLAGRMSVAEFVVYAVAQICGAILGAWILYLIASGKADYVLATNGLGQNGYGPGYLGEYSLGAALIFEGVMTFLFVTVILGTTRPGAAPGFAGLAIGLTLAAIHMVGINVTGVSVNPARSIGPALFVGGTAVSQLWVFIVAPMVGGGLAGLVHALGLTKAAAPVSADQRARPAIGFVIVPAQTLQGDAQHDLARPRGPAHAPLGRLDAFQKTADPQRHIAQTRPQIAQRQCHAVARGARPLGAAAVGMKAAPVARRQKPVPVLRHARPHLRQFEILAQAFGRLDQILFQKCLAILVAPPPQHRHRAFRKIIAYPRPPALVAGNLAWCPTRHAAQQRVRRPRPARHGPPPPPPSSVSAPTDPVADNS